MSYIKNKEVSLIVKNKEVSLQCLIGLLHHSDVSLRSGDIACLQELSQGSS